MFQLSHINVFGLAVRGTLVQTFRLEMWGTNEENIISNL